MREIKFRAWDKKYKRIIDAENWDTGAIINMEGQCGKPFWELMQFTGLKDKNGKEIYEGDIVNIQVRENIGTFNVPDDIIANNGYTGRDDVYEGEVVFDTFGYGVNDKEAGIIYLQPMEDTFFEVIGNIYENPEMREKL